MIKDGTNCYTPGNDMKSPGWLYKKAGLWKGICIGLGVSFFVGLIVGAGLGFGLAHWQINSDYLYKQNQTYLTIFKNHWNEFKRIPKDSIEEGL
jgi:hypothetical protein